MKNYCTPARFAGTAIAAVLALSSTALLAQTVVEPPVAPQPSAAPPVVTSVTPMDAGAIAPPSTTGAPVTVFAPSTPVVQQTPPAPAPESQPSALRSASSSVGKTALSPTKPSQVVNEVAPKASPSQVAVTPAQIPGAVRDDAAQLPIEVSPSAAEPMPVGSPPVEPVPAEAVTSANDATPANWALGVGLALLLGSAAAYAFVRRRTTGVVGRDAKGDNLSYVTSPVPPDPMIGTHRAMETLTNADDRDAAREEYIEAETVVGNYREPLATRTYAAMISPAVAGGSLSARREAMIAERPCVENPFLTRKNRLRRANFLIAQQNGLAEPELVQERSTEADLSIAETRVRQPHQLTYTIKGGNQPQRILRPRFS